MVMPLIDFAQSQKECYNTVSFCPTERKEGFTKNMQSLSGAFEQGDTSKHLTYRININELLLSNRRIESMIFNNLGTWQR